MTSLNEILKPKSKREILALLENCDLDPNDLLIKSSLHGFLYGVKKALKIGANVHSYTDYALRLALQYNHYNMVKLLLKNGADVHVLNDLPLKLALEKGRDNVTELLKKYM